MIILVILFALVISVVTTLLLAFPVMWFFNYLAYSFGWVEVGYWQVVAALVLLSVVGSFFRSGGSSS